jgi:hypothetical protein
MRKSLHLVGGMAALLLSGSALAWGPLGHHTVGAIADQLLNDKARAAVAVLLVGDLDKDGNPSGRTSLQQVASWPDEIRSTPANQPKWHFDDAPACRAFDRARPWCANGECATQKIEELSKTLADPQAATRERNEALKWIVHLVGDVHQPLHATTNVYAAGEQDHFGNPTDRGGNDVQVALSGVKTKGAVKLHGAWDSELVEVALGVSAPYPTPTTVNKLAKEAQQLPASQLLGGALDWAEESHKLASSTAYHFNGFACFQPDDGNNLLPAAYVKAASATVHTRLVLAGARLARLLNEVLGK